MSSVVYLEQNSITTEELELLHGVGMKCDDGVVIVYSLINNEPVRRLLALKDRGAEVSFRTLTEETESVRFIVKRKKND